MTAESTTTRPATPSPAAPGAATDEPAGYKYVGTRSIRPDGLDKVTGRARFGADRHLPGMLTGAVLRSPHAHATIRSIDTSAAAAVPGVKAVITAADFPEITSEEAHAGESVVDFRDLSHNVMARYKVLYVGHPVAAVAATSRRAAERALEAIVVEYEVHPHVTTVAEAMAADAPILHDDLVVKGFGDDIAPNNVAQRHLIERGDVAAAFADAHLVIERQFTTKPVHQGYIEPHAVVADTSEDGHGVVWVSSQGHFLMRDLTAKVLGWDASRLRVLPAEIGGGFGGKTTIYLEPLAVLLSSRSGRPVKMVMDRSEVFMASGPAPGSHMRVKMGAAADGRLVAAEAVLAFEAGAFAGSPVGAACQTSFAPYDIPDVRIEGLDVIVNTPKVAAYRAPGAPLAAFAVETIVDEIARELDIDPIEMRYMNAAEEGTKSPRTAACSRQASSTVSRSVGLSKTTSPVSCFRHQSCNKGCGI